MNPILRWAGGKRWLTAYFQPLIENINYDRFVEPFAGSAALFFSIQPSKALLNDANKNLIETYESVKSDWKAVFSILTLYEKMHSKEFYYSIRTQTSNSPYARAANFIYLNRACFNGLYRVNLKGEFNVPIGKNNKVLFSQDDLLNSANALSSAELSSDDFEKVVDKSRIGDLLFIDPPYTVKHNSNGFIHYNEKLFTWDDQVRLHDCALRARDRGAHIFISNADHSSVRELYHSAKRIHVIDRYSTMAAAASSRKSTTELLIELY